MIVVSVHLRHATQPGKVTELARMELCNEGGSKERRNYLVRILRGRSTLQLDQHVVHKKGEVLDFPSEAVHVWNLVASALATLGYGRRR